MWLRESLDIMVNYHHVQCQKKANNLVLIKFSNGWADRQIDESDLIGHCPTNIECPI